MKEYTYKNGTTYKMGKNDVTLCNPNHEEPGYLNAPIYFEEDRYFLYKEDNYFDMRIYE